MYKIRKIQFQNHPILGNLMLNFCDQNNHTIDTIILAGENGTGKSTVLDALYDIATHRVKIPLLVELEKESEIITLTYYMKPGSSNYAHVKDTKTLDDISISSLVSKAYNFKGIYSDVDINFKVNELSSVTSLNLDTVEESQKSSNNLPTQIKQLLIDIQALDDASIASFVKENPNVSCSDIHVNERMERFTNAFNKMFENLSYSEIKNIDNHKSIIFKKFNKQISIDNLSSGEKQIVYRGCFLLKDVNAMNGAFVFIDEPEISLHPNWQKKILDFYKDIYTDKDGKQTSQIFTVTHSPFIIHNEYRKNDKVIVLSSNDNGDIIAIDKPEYYKCDSLEIVKDAFNVKNFLKEEPTIYVAGRTDEMYFDRAIKLFKLSVPFKFKWIGYLNENGQEENTGDSSLKRVEQFLISENSAFKNICLYDCDANKSDSVKNNLYVRSIPKYENAKNMKKGIENALVLDNVDTAPFYECKTKEGDYGDNNIIVEFKKMDFCKYICSLEEEKLKQVFYNIQSVLESLIKIFNDM